MATSEPHTRKLGGLGAREERAMPSIHQELWTRSIRTVKNGRKDMGIILLDVYIFVFFSHRRSVSCGSQAGAVIHATGARKKNQTLSPSTYAPLAPTLDTPTAKPCIFGAPPPLSRSQIWLPFNQNLDLARASTADADVPPPTDELVLRQTCCTTLVSFLNRPRGLATVRAPCSCLTRA